MIMVRSDATKIKLLQTRSGISIEAMDLKTKSNVSYVSHEILSLRLNFRDFHIQVNVKM